MRLVFLLACIILFPTIIFSQANLLANKLEKELKKEKEIKRKISLVEYYYNQNPQQTCQDLENLLLKFQDDIPSYCALYLRKMNFCDDAKNHSDNNKLKEFDELLQKLPNECEKIVFWTNLAVHFVNNNYPKISESYLEKAKALVKNKNYEKCHFFILFFEYQQHTIAKQFDLAFAKLLEAENFYFDNNLNFDYDFFLLQTNIGSVYYNAENYAASEKQYLKALEIAEKHNWLERPVINAYNTLGLAQKNLKKYKEAYENFLKAMQVAEIIEDSVWIGILQGNMAEIDIINKEYEKAEEKLNNYLNYALKYQEHGIVVTAHIKFAYLFNLKNDTETSLKHLREAEAYLEKHQEAIKNSNFVSFLKYQRRLFETFTTTFKQRQAYKEALEYAQKLILINDSINKVLNKEKITELEGKYRLKEQERENAFLKEKAKIQAQNLSNQHKIIVAVIAAFVLALLLVSYMFYYNRVRKKYAKSLEEINHFKDKIFSIVSHDLRSYMSSLKGYVYLVQNQELEKEELQALTRELSRNTEQSFVLVDNLLLWAKSQLGGQVLTLKDYSVKGILQEVFFEIAWFAQSKEISLNLDIKNDFIVLVDKNVLSIALRNILNNAIKFSKPQQNIDISVLSEGSLCKIIFQDEGVGISPENLEKIRKKISFTQRGTQSEKGTGLGLTLIQEAIEKLNGTLEIESVLGKGTKVTITLPAIEKIHNKNLTTEANENFIS